MQFAQLRADYFLKERYRGYFISRELSQFPANAFIVYTICLHQVRSSTLHIGFHFGRVEFLIVTMSTRPSNVGWALILARRCKFALYLMIVMS